MVTLSTKEIIRFILDEQFICPKQMQYRLLQTACIHRRNLPRVHHHYHHHRRHRRRQLHSPSHRHQRIVCMMCSEEVLLQSE